MNKIKLTSAEILQASSIGVIRQIQNINKNRKNAHGLSLGNDWQIHIEGALGEFAVAKFLNIFWNGSIGNLSNTDVGRYEIRTTSNDNYNLIVHKDDKDDSPFILVTGQNGEYYIHGWMFGSDAKNKKYWSDPTKGRPAYFIPQSDLHSIDTLPRN